MNNGVTLVGRLGMDPEFVQTDSGKQKANFRLATKSPFRQEADWHNIVLWGKQAEIAKEYLKKGSQVSIGGEIRYSTWTDKEGRKCYKTEIHGSSLTMLSRAGDSEPSDAPF